jgi:type I restriction enzyme, S subunit
MGSTHQTIYMPDVQRIAIPLPPVEVQQRVVVFLDAESARIDALIEKKQRMIKLLAARRREALSIAALQGVRDHQLRSSRSGFLGHVPKAWEETQLRHLDFEVQTGPFGSQLHASDYVDDGWPVINPANLVDGTIIPNTQASVSDERRADLRLHVIQRNDILIGRRGEMGRAALVTDAEEGWLCGTGCLLLRSRRSRIDPAYLLALLRTPALRGYFSLASVGSTMENLNAEIVLGAPVVVPAREEQLEIIDFGARLATTDNAVTPRLERQITLLREHRQALITAAVTGQLDLAKAAA